jgi:hypothetical protein
MQLMENLSLFNPPVVPLFKGGQAMHRPTLGAFIHYFAQFLSEGVPLWWSSAVVSPKLSIPKGGTRGIHFL